MKYINKTNIIISLHNKKTKQNRLIIIIIVIKLMIKKQNKQTIKTKQTVSSWRVVTNLRNGTEYLRFRSATKMCNATCTPLIAMSKMYPET